MSKILKKEQIKKSIIVQWVPFGGLLRHYVLLKYLTVLSKFLTMGGKNHFFVYTNFNILLFGLKKNI